MKCNPIRGLKEQVRETRPQNWSQGSKLLIMVIMERDDHIMYHKKGTWGIKQDHNVKVKYIYSYLYPCGKIKWGVDLFEREMMIVMWSLK